VASLPLVIAPNRTTTLGGERLTSQRLLVEVEKQSLSDVRFMMRSIAEAQVAAQARQGNPASVTAVDGGTGRDIDAALRKVVVLFGVVLAAAAMREVESALRDAIAASTRTHSGRLADIAGSWQWLYIPKGGTARVVSPGAVLPAFNRGDQLVLTPQGVPHATLTNRNVAHSGRLNRAPKKGKEPPKSQQNRGFLFNAADKVRRRPAFAQFSVRVVFSRAHMVPGELMTREQGTGMLVIAAKSRASR
jgi:hypothetical protein